MEKQDSKECTRCLIVKTLDEFHRYKRHKTGYLSACKSCEATRKKSAEAIIQRQQRYKKNRRKIIEYNKQHRLKHLEKSKATTKRYYENNKIMWLEAGWKQKGILNEDGKYFKFTDYTKLRASQNDVCAICFKDGSDHKKRLVVDHDHDTGIYRGILCSFCNTAIAYMKDDPVILLNAIEYLKKNKNYD